MPVNCEDQQPRSIIVTKPTFTAAKYFLKMLFLWIKLIKLWIVWIKID